MEAHELEDVGKNSFVFNRGRYWFFSMASAGTMRLELGTTRALACADRRPRRSEPGSLPPPKGGALEATGVVGGGANHRTRGRVRSPVNCMDTAQCFCLKECLGALPDFSLL
jgi:hypothetical protein